MAEHGIDHAETVVRTHSSAQWLRSVTRVTDTADGGSKPPRPGRNSQTNISPPGIPAP